jgi:hypothetical protein
MPLTTAEQITAVLEYAVNQGDSAVAEDPELRKRTHFFLTKVCRRVWNAAPHWWRLGNSTVALTAGVGTMPSDFAHLGDMGDIYVQGQKYWKLIYQPPDKINYLVQNNPQSGIPRTYTLQGKTATGVPQIQCWPSDNSTLVVTRYVKLMPELIDAPLAPVLAAAAGGGLADGARTGRVTFVTADGEVEGGTVSASASTATTNNSYAWTSIPTWWGRTVTSRKLYRTAVGGTQHKLVDTISDNTTTSYTDTTVDGSLGADVPTPATAASGIEIFPTDFHESAIWDGLLFFSSRILGDGRDVRFSAEWDRSVRQMWDEIRQGQNEIQAMPAFPGYETGHPVWSHWSPPE